MTHSDKILGTAVSNNQVTRTYSTHKVEYNGDPLAQEILVTEDGEQVTLEESEQTLEDYFSGELRVDEGGAEETYIDDEGNSQQYEHRVVVEDATTRDEVVSELAGAGLRHDSYQFELTDKQKYIIERENATGSEVDEALKWKSNLLDRELVTNEKKRTIANAIQQISTQDPELGQSLDEIFEVFTGQTVDEFLDE